MGAGEQADSTRYEDVSLQTAGSSKVVLWSSGILVARSYLSIESSITGETAVGDRSQLDGHAFLRGRGTTDSLGKNAVSCGSHEASDKM